MSLKQKAAKGIAWSFVQRWGSQVISFSVFLLLARLLGPEDFGLIAMSGVFIAFMRVFLDQGFASAIVQRQDLEPEHLDTAFWISIGISLVLMALTWATAGLVAHLYHEPELTWVIRLLSINFVFKALNSVQNAILTRQMAFRPLAVRALIGITAGGAVGVAMALMGFGVWSLVGYQLANGIVEVPVLWMVSDWRPGLRLSKPHFRELFNFGIHVVGMNGLIFLSNYSDNLLVGYYLGPTALGYYTIAYRVLTVLTTLLAKTTNQVAFPTFSRLQHDPERLRRAFCQATRLTSLIAFPVFLGISAVASELVPVVFGEQWAPSIPVMQVLAFLGILRTVFQFNGPIMLAMGQPDWQLKINVFNTVMNVLCFFIAVRWGILAVAIALVARSYLSAPLGFWLIQKLIRVKIVDYLKEFGVPLLSAGIMVATIFAVKSVWPEQSDPRQVLVTSITAGGLVYGGSVFLLAPDLYRQVLSFTQGFLAKPATKK